MGELREEIQNEEDKLSSAFSDGITGDQPGSL
jgi:hypothetical protein